ncbi:MAG: hypothetical protein JWO74_47 [Solirubrobacterales bacterium]|nr:hypothetical protein [Solirubrobacterales bacterium]
MIGARFPDPAGLKLELRDGASVRRGTPLAQVRDDDDPVRLAERIASYFRVVEIPPGDATRPTMEIIGG